MAEKPVTSTPLRPKIADAPGGALARIYVYRALKTLQAANLRALQTGEWCGHSTDQMAALLDRELGFSQLYAALALYVENFGDPLKVARVALAKARGESDAK